MNSDRLVKNIMVALENETRRIVEEEAKKAATRVEERVRAKAGEIATLVTSNVSFERFGPDLRITVHLPERPQQ